jgi:hypothetical protein
MSEMCILVLPPGAEDAPICHADHSFAPYRLDPRNPASVWLVEVTPEAAVQLLHKGGFSLHAPAMRRRLSGMMVRMIHKEGPRSCGWDGEAYEPDESGAVTVPVEAQEDLSSHDFVGAPAPLPSLPDETASETAPSSELQQIRTAVTEARADLADFDEKNPEAKGRADTAAAAKAKPEKRA